MPHPRVVQHPAMQLDVMAGVDSVPASMLQDFAVFCSGGRAIA